MSEPRLICEKDEEGSYPDYDSWACRIRVPADKTHNIRLTLPLESDLFIDGEEGV